MAEEDSATNSLANGITGLLNNPIATGVGGAIGGAIVGSLATAAFTRSSGSQSSSRSRSRKRSSITHTKRGWKQDRKRFNKRQKWEVAYRRKKHKRGVKYTKNGQPYIILASGKARFIKGKRRA